MRTRVGSDLPEEALDRDETKAQPQRAIHPMQRFGPEGSQAFSESLPVHGANLIRKHNGVYFHAGFRRQDEHFGRIERFFIAGRNGAYDCDRAVAVCDIVLNDKRRARLLNLGSDGWVEIHEIDFAALGDDHP
jgi:hypothetical protein